MTDKVQKIREEVARMHNLLPVMDGDNISVNYADRICTTLEMYIDSLQEEPANIDFEQELYNHFGQVKDFTTGMRIARYFYEMGAQRTLSQFKKIEGEGTDWYSHHDSEYICGFRFEEPQKLPCSIYIKVEEKSV